MKNEKKINLGIIGKNFGYKVIYRSFKKNKKFNVVSFASRSKKNLKKIPKKIKLFSNWKRLILDKNVHAIAIATPPILHKKITIFAIKNKKHIFCEKPFTTSKKDADQIIKLIKKNKKLVHMVNYEFPEIEAFKIFKNKILKKKITINNVCLNWFLEIKDKKNNWKNNYKQGGGIFYNYLCHSINYLEYFFGKIISVEAVYNFSFNKTKYLDSVFLFKNNLSVNVKIKIFNDKLNKPIHQLSVETEKNQYFLESKVNNLFDQFKIIQIKKSIDGNFKKRKVIFKNNPSRLDFRIKPTYKNTEKFSKCILNRKIIKPNFYDATRIHEIINRVQNSFKIKKKMYIN